MHEGTEQALAKFPAWERDAGNGSGRHPVASPEMLLVDEPSIGLEPRYIDRVFEILDDLQHQDGKTIVLVEQNATKGLEFADIGYVLVSDRSPWPVTARNCWKIPRWSGCFWGDRSSSSINWESRAASS
ncbi:hypothetical protein [Sedimenticola selenatireducens]|uniref:hypothetical protein n=1 Tax=Sedimenticola selenatireducens TaxID=191960 RepID=UPI000491ABF1